MANGTAVAENKVEEGRLKAENRFTKMLVSSPVPATETASTAGGAIAKLALPTTKLRVKYLRTQPKRVKVVP